MRGFVLHDVEFAHGTNQIFYGLSVQIGSGSFTTIVGPNGVGKSTLLELLAGFVRPGHGEISLDGRQLSSMSRIELARVRSFLASPAGRELSFTTREVIAMGTYPWSADGRDHGDRVEELMSSLGLLELADRPVSTLSSGEARRTELARVLAQSTSTILLDEPLASLDLRHAESVMSLLKQHAVSGATVVAVVHDLNAAVRYADRAVLIRPGGSVDTGDPRQVFTSERLSAAYGISVEVAQHGTGLVFAPEIGRADGAESSD